MPEGKRLAMEIWRKKELTVIGPLLIIDGHAVMAEQAVAHV